MPKVPTLVEQGQAPWRLQTEQKSAPGAGKGLAKTVEKSGIQFRGGNNISPVEKEYMRRLTEDPRFGELHDIVQQEILLLLPKSTDISSPPLGVLGQLLEMWLRDLGRLAMEIWEVERTNFRAAAAKDHITKLEQNRVHAHRTYMQELSALRDQMRLLDRRPPVDFEMSIDDIYFYEPTKYFEGDMREFVKEIVTYKVRQTLAHSHDEEGGNLQEPQAKLVTAIKEKEEEIVELKETIRDLEYSAAQDGRQRVRPGPGDMDLHRRKHDNDKKDGRARPRPASRSGTATLAIPGAEAGRCSSPRGEAGRCASPRGLLCRQCGGAVREEEQSGGESSPSSPSNFEGGVRQGSLRRGFSRGASFVKGEERSPARRDSADAGTQKDWQGGSARRPSKTDSRSAGKHPGEGIIPPWGSGGKPKRMLNLLAEIAEAKGLVRELRQQASQAADKQAKLHEKQAKEQEKRIREVVAKLEAEYGDLRAFFPEVADCGVNTLPMSSSSTAEEAAGGSPTGSRSPGKHRGGAVGIATQGAGVMEAPSHSRSPSRRTSCAVGEHTPRQRSAPRFGADLPTPTSRYAQGEGYSGPRLSMSGLPGRTFRGGGGHENSSLEAVEEAMALSEELMKRQGALSILAETENRDDMDEAVRGMNAVVHRLSHKLSSVRDSLSSGNGGRASAGATEGGEAAAPQGQRFQELKHQLYETTEKLAQAEFSMSELQLKLKEMQQKLRDAGLGEVAERIMDAVGLRQIASVAAQKEAVNVFDRLYRDAVLRIHRIGDPTDPSALRSRALRTMRQPLQMARRAAGMAEDSEFYGHPAALDETETTAEASVPQSRRTSVLQGLLEPPEARAQAGLHRDQGGSPLERPDAQQQAGQRGEELQASSAQSPQVKSPQGLRTPQEQRSPQSHSPQPRLVAAGQQMIPHSTALSTARHQTQVPAVQTSQPRLVAAGQQMIPHSTALSAARAETPVPAVQTQQLLQPPQPLQPPQTSGVDATQQAWHQMLLRGQHDRGDGAAAPESPPAAEPSPLGPAGPAADVELAVGRAASRGGGRRGVKAALVRQDANDWMDPLRVRSTFGASNRPRDPLWSPRSLPSQDMPLSHSLSDSGLTPRDSAQTQSTAWWSAASLPISSSLPLSSAGPVMGPKRSNAAGSPGKPRQVSPRAPGAERPSSRSGLPPVQASAAEPPLAVGRTPSNAEGEGLAFLGQCASAPALVLAEPLPPLERPPTGGVGGLGKHHAELGTTVAFKQGVAAALLPLGHQEFVSLSGDTIFILKAGKKKKGFEEYTMARFIGGQGQQRAKLAIGGQALS